MSETTKYEWLGPMVVVDGKMRQYGAFYEFTSDQAESLAAQGYIAIEKKKPAEKPAAAKKKATRTTKG